MAKGLFLAFIQLFFIESGYFLNSFVKNNFEEILKPEKLVFNQNTSTLTSDGLLYFIDGLSIGSNRFGVIDINERKLLWFSKLKIKSRYKIIQSVQLKDNFLYVHADDCSLHIFENE